MLHVAERGAHLVRDRAMPALARDRIDRPHTGEEDVIADTYAGHVRQVGASRRVEHRVDRLDYRTRQSRGGARLARAWPPYEQRATDGFPPLTSFPLVVCRSRKSDTLLAAVIGPPSSDARAVHSIMTFTPSGRRAPHTVRAGGGSGKSVHRSRSCSVLPTCCAAGRSPLRLCRATTRMPRGSA